MIVRDRPNAFALLITLRGSIVLDILPHMLLVALFSAGLTAVHHYGWLDISSLTVLPITLLGLVLSILLSFRNNASYERWWEARKQWGRMVCVVRSLARDSATLLAQDDSDRRRMLHLVLAHAHALRGQLRQEPVHDTLTAWVSNEDVNRALACRNGADGFLRQIGDLLGRAYRDGRLDSVGLQMLNRHLCELSAIQGACERIALTPLPFAYTLLAHRTAYLYCYLLPFALVGSIGWATPVCVVVVAYTFFGLDCLAEHLEAPFGRDANDLPLDALCRTHEISVSEALGDTAPAPLPVVSHQLQ
ncbi:MAG: bestrophin family ion channel [Alcanivorax sp.]|nr:bestrophin family ion channel [Alcanivorax sp.]